MSEPHCLHLLVADSAVTDHHRYRVHPALCGAVLTSELPSCEPGCEREGTYCLVCLRTASGRDHDAEVTSAAAWGDRVEPAVSGVHLFSAAELADGHRYPVGFVAVCGAVMRPCSATPAPAPTRGIARRA